MGVARAGVERLSKLAKRGLGTPRRLSGPAKGCLGSGCQMEDELLKLTHNVVALMVDLLKKVVDDYKKLVGFEISLIQTVVVVWVLLVPRPESDLVVTVASQSFLHRGSCVGFACRGAVASRSGLADNDIDLFLDGSLRVGRGIPRESTVILGEWSLVSDIALEMSLPNEVFTLVFEVVAFLHVMSMLSVEVIISSFVTPFQVCFEWVRGA
ncbi:hypothetical protein B296_00032763 [Ensete ventricosum]|uniref:Uncharacterized protein n=1 Tax=Ensete ventricosum TaxID=4639 RepID=A0A426ZE14_ENSVE|nr:hypothetical protein B296_00032763 [Ensete ventricosum]